jgi:hypothetical protein
MLYHFLANSRCHSRVWTYVMNLPLPPFLAVTSPPRRTLLCFHVCVSTDGPESGAKRINDRRHAVAFAVWERHSVCETRAKADSCRRRLSKSGWRQVIRKRYGDMKCKPQLEASGRPKLRPAGTEEESLIDRSRASTRPWTSAWEAAASSANNILV